MTAAPVIAPQEAPDIDPDGDWAVALRLMNWRDVGERPPTPADIRLTIWVLLDLGAEPMEIMRRLGVELRIVRNIAGLRQRAIHYRPPHSGRGRPPQTPDPRMLAPTAMQRLALSVPGYTRPGSDLELLCDVSSP